MASDNDIDSPVAESKMSNYRKRVVEVSLEESNLASTMPTGPLRNVAGMFFKASQKSRQAKSEILFLRERYFLGMDIVTDESV